MAGVRGRSTRTERRKPDASEQQDTEKLQKQMKNEGGHDGRRCGERRDDWGRKRLCQQRTKRGVEPDRECVSKARSSQAEAAAYVLPCTYTVPSAA